MRAETAQHDGPHPLHHRVECQSRLSQERLQRTSLLGVESNAEFDSRALVSGHRHCAFWQRRCRAETAQNFRPVGIGARGIQRFTPPKIRAQFTGTITQRRQPARRPNIVCQELIKHQIARPAIKQQVMAGPHQFMNVLSHLNQGQPEYRRLFNVEAELQIGGEETLQALSDIKVVPPIKPGNHRNDMLEYHLNRLLDLTPVHSGPQRVMTVDHTSPRCFKQLPIKSAGQPATHVNQPRTLLVADAVP